VTTPARPHHPDYRPTGNRFSGDIAWVQIDIGEDSDDHLIATENRIHIALVRQ
jgi:arylsulfatase